MVTTVAFAFVLFVSSTGGNEDSLQVCDEVECQLEGRALLQVGRRSTISSLAQVHTCESGIGQDATLDEPGYNSVRHEDCSQEMLIFVRRLIEGGKVACDYSQEACRRYAQAQGLQLGGLGVDFAGNYKTKGCYTYASGKYAGRAYYGLDNGGDLTSEGQLGALSSPQQIRVSTCAGKVCVEGALGGLIPFFDCDDDHHSYADLQAALAAAADPNGDCSWIGAPTCPPFDTAICGSFPGATFAPCAYETQIQTTTPGPTTPGPTTPGPTTPGPTTPGPTTPGPTTPGPTTPGPTTSTSGCMAQPMDIFMAIDASKSVEKTGWAAQASFASALVDKLLGGGNPKGNRINAHWFNGITSPVTPAAGVIATGGTKGPDGATNINDIGTFVSTEQAVVKLRQDIEALDYPTIRNGATDHPQVYVTADKFYSTSASTSNNAKVVVLITDGETHSGDNCKELKKDATTVFATVGNCPKDPTHACTRTNGQTSCDLEKCMCGLYRSYEFKQKGYTLVIVAIKNNHHDAMFQKQMSEMASPGRLYFANEFSDLSNLVTDIKKDLCV